MKRGEDMVYGYTLSEGGQRCLDVYPIDADGDLDHDGVALVLACGFPEGSDSCFDAEVAVRLERQMVEGLRDALTSWLEGTWAGIGINSLPQFPVEGGLSLDKGDHPG